MLRLHLPPVLEHRRSGARRRSRGSRGPRKGAGRRVGHTLGNITSDARPTSVARGASVAGHRQRKSAGPHPRAFRVPAVPLRLLRPRSRLHPPVLRRDPRLPRGSQHRHLGGLRLLRQPDLRAHHGQRDAHAEHREGRGPPGSDAALRRPARLGRVRGAWPAGSAPRACAFVLEPRIRYAGQPGEQATMFLLDPSGNALEFKSFRHPEHVFTA